MQLVSRTSSKSGLAVGTFSQNTFVLEARFCHAELTEGDQCHSPDIAQPLQSVAGGHRMVHTKTWSGRGDSAGVEGHCERLRTSKTFSPTVQQVGTRGGIHEWNISNLLYFSEIMNVLINLHSVNRPYRSPFSHLVHLQAG